MLLDYYQLREQPFGVSPDPAYLYPSRTHCEALDALSEAILSDRGFLALIGEPGMGKTTLLHQVVEAMQETARAIFLTQTQCSSREFFEYLMSELGVDPSNLSLVGMHKKLNEILFAEMMAGRRFVLIVDEAQNLEESVLETIRMLSNYETPNYKLIQVILAGQLQLQTKLQREQMAQLAQRITVMKQLEALSGAETAAYVRHRLRVAGHPDGELFEREALALIAERSRGVPRDINKICFRALTEGYAAKRRTISAEVVEAAAGKLEFFAGQRPAPSVKAAQAVAVTSSRPRVVGLRRRRARRGLALAAPASVSRTIWQGALTAALTVAAVALPYHGARRMMGSLRVDAAMMNALPTSAGANADDRTREVWPGEERRGTNDTAADAPSATAIRVDTLASNTRHWAKTDYGQPGIRGDEELLPLGPRLSLTRELGLSVRRIAIDPGHGGSDTGTKGPNGLMEKDLCLDVALRLGRLIEESIPGAQVIYTRTDDRHVPLEERTAIANEAKADLFISIHANSSESPEIRGVETYYVSLAGSREEGEIATRENAEAGYSLHNLPELVRKITRNENLTESRQLATDIQGALSRRLQLVNRGERNRGVKRAPFVVLTGTNMPSVLSEISFVSNPSDERLLLESEQRQRVTEGLYRGIVEYLGRMPSRINVEQPKTDESPRIASTGIASTVSEGSRTSLDGLGVPGTRP
jgi:N-acetylmuramoyl-L-alanine amidase